MIGITCHTKPKHLLTSFVEIQTKLDSELVCQELQVAKIHHAGMKQEYKCHNHTTLAGRHHAALSGTEPSQLRYNQIEK